MRNSKKSSASKQKLSRVATTFPKSENGEFYARLNTIGVRVLEIPLGRASEGGESEDIVSEILSGFGEYEWLVFSGATSVHAFFRRFFSKYKDLRSLGPCRIACAGNATARAIENLHLQVDCVSEEETVVAVTEKMRANESLENLKICVVPSSVADEVASRKLEKDDRAIVDMFPTCADEIDLSTHPAAMEFRDKGADIILFSSGVAAKAFVAQAGMFLLSETARRPRVVAIGDSVASTLKKSGVPVAEIFRSFADPLLVEMLRKLA